MELASSQLIRALIGAHQTASQIGQGGNASAPPRPANGERRRPCQCGRCRACVDNARWERIFAEKFADPTYYNR